MKYNAFKGVKAEIKSKPYYNEGMDGSMTLAGESKIAYIGGVQVGFGMDELIHEELAHRWNSHEGLVEALEYLLEALPEEFISGHPNDIEVARKALSKAKGDSDVV